MSADSGSRGSFIRWPKRISSFCAPGPEVFFQGCPRVHRKPNHRLEVRVSGLPKGKVGQRIVKGLRALSDFGARTKVALDGLGMRRAKVWLLSLRALSGHRPLKKSHPDLSSRLRLLCTRFFNFPGGEHIPLLALTLRGTRASSFLTALSSLHVSPLCQGALLRDRSMEPSQVKATLSLSHGPPMTRDQIQRVGDASSSPQMPL